MFLFPSHSSFIAFILFALSNLYGEEIREQKKWTACTCDICILSIIKLSMFIVQKFVGPFISFIISSVWKSNSFNRIQKKEKPIMYLFNPTDIIIHSTCITYVGYVSAFYLGQNRETKKNHINNFFPVHFMYSSLLFLIVSQKLWSRRKLQYFNGSFQSIMLAKTN